MPNAALVPRQPARLSLPGSAVGVTAGKLSLQADDELVAEILENVVGEVRAEAVGVNPEDLRAAAEAVEAEAAVAIGTAGAISLRMVFAGGDDRIQRDARGDDRRAVRIDDAAAQRVTAAVDDQRQVAVPIAFGAQSLDAEAVARGGVDVQRAGREVVQAN